MSRYFFPVCFYNAVARPLSGSRAFPVVLRFSRLSFPLLSLLLLVSPLLIEVPRPPRRYLLHNHPILQRPRRRLIPSRDPTQPCPAPQMPILKPPPGQIDTHKIRLHATLELLHGRLIAILHPDPPSHDPFRKLLLGPHIRNRRHPLNVVELRLPQLDQPVLGGLESVDGIAQHDRRDVGLEDVGDDFEPALRVGALRLLDRQAPVEGVAQCVLVEGVVLDEQLADLRHAARGEGCVRGPDQARRDDFDVGVAEELEAVVGHFLLGGVWGLGLGLGLGLVVAVDVDLALVSEDCLLELWGYRRDGWERVPALLKLALTVGVGAVNFCSRFLVVVAVGLGPLCFALLHHGWSESESLLNEYEAVYLV